MPARESAVSSAGRARRIKIEAFKVMTANQGGPRSAHANSDGADRTRWNLQMTLPTADRAVRVARLATRDALVAWQLACFEETAVLLVSELVTNAVRHTRGSDAITLELQAAGTRLRIEVTDADPRWPQPRIPAEFDGSGFGLVLVDALAGKWGVRDTAAGKAVWAELDEGQSDEPQA